MIDWTVPTNGTEVTLNAIVQVLIVVLTASLTWTITRASDRRAERRNRQAAYRHEIERYYDALLDATNFLDDLVQRQEGEGIPAVEGAPYGRFLGRTFWHPRPEDVAVDSWVRTELAWIPNRMATLTTEDAWGEYQVHVLRKRLRDTVHDFERWIEGELQSTEFRDRLEGMNMRVWAPRFGDPLAQSASRLRRLSIAFGESLTAIRRAWDG